jgi:hypothetical protein
MLDAPPREAEPFTRITRRYRAVRSLPLAPSSVVLIASPECAAFTKKSELTTGGSLPFSITPPPIRILMLFLFPLAHEPLFRVARASRVLVSPSRRNDIPCSHTALSPLPSSRSPRLTPHNVSGISPSACSTRRGEFLLLHAPCSLLCPYTGGSLQGKRIIQILSASNCRFSGPNTR